MFPGIPNIENSSFSYTDSDSLRREIEDFLHCVRHSRSPIVSGEDGHRALELATRISDIIAEDNR